MIPLSQLAFLESAAVAAIGRKEMRCQVAMADLYKVAGALPADLEIPAGDRDWSRSHGRSLIEEWLATSPYFERVEIADRAPGDLLCFRLGHAPHHVSLLLGRGRMVHVFGEHGVQIAPNIPAAWAKRINSVWRIRG